MSIRPLIDWHELFLYPFRVSFGSSKGSMVETLVFEAPTPLPEHSEREFNFPDSKNGSSSTNNGDDSGIELQEE